MLRFLLGALVGAAAAATWLQRPLARASAASTGRVDELSTAQHNVVADPAVNAGDGTSGHEDPERRSSAVTP